MANPRGQQRAKKFRQALELEIADAEGDAKTLRRIARALIEKAAAGDVSAIKEIADRLDGKVPQAIVGDDELDPIRMDMVTDEDRAKAILELISRARQGAG